jgi:hypothetical protein
MTDQRAAVPATPARGRTPPLDEREADRIFWQGVAHFNGARYWHAHEEWETLWRAAPDEDRDFYQGLIKVAAGLLHLGRRNPRGARTKLDEGLAQLRPYAPKHHGIVVSELVGTGGRILEDLRSGELPYLIPPVIKEVEVEGHPHLDR